jgi:hypothetical protein
LGKNHLNVKNGDCEESQPHDWESGEGHRVVYCYTGATLQFLHLPKWRHSMSLVCLKIFEFFFKDGSKFIWNPFKKKKKKGVKLLKLKSVLKSTLGENMPRD